MPIFEIEAPSGRFQVDAPDEGAALAALNSMPEAENSVSGSAKALGSGLLEGVAGLAGLPGDIAELGARGIDRASQFVGGKLGLDIKPRTDQDPTYGSAAAMRAVEGVTGELPKPQTGLERTLHTIGSFAPAILGGPESLATRIGTRAVLPGLASEAAGTLTQGTDAEPYARIAGALGGAVAGSKIAAAASRPAIAAVPSKTELEAAKSSGYRTQAMKDAEYNPTAVEKFVDDAKDILKKQRISEKQAEKVYDALDGLKAPAFKSNHTIQDFDETRRLLNKIAGNFADPVQAGAAQRVIRSIDAFTLRPPTGAAVDAAVARQASRDLFQARANAAAGFRSQRIQDAIEKAKNTAGATHSGGNLQNEIQKQFRSIANDPKKMRGFNEQERAAIREIARGTVPGNLLRRTGKLLGGGGGLGQLASGSAGGAMFGWPGMLALPAAGMAANKLGSMSVMRQANKLDELVRSRSPLYGAANQAAYQQRLAGGGLLAGLPQPEQTALLALLSQRSAN